MGQGRDCTPFIPKPLGLGHNPGPNPWGSTHVCSAGQRPSALLFQAGEGLLARRAPE